MLGFTVVSGEPLVIVVALTVNVLLSPASAFTMFHAVTAAVPFWVRSLLVKLESLIALLNTTVKAIMAPYYHRGDI